jgi:hypothetical protein
MLWLISTNQARPVHLRTKQKQHASDLDTIQRNIEEDSR